MTRRVVIGTVIAITLATSVFLVANWNRATSIVQDAVRTVTVSAESWIGEQLHAIAQAHLNVDLEWESFELLAADTVRLRRVSLIEGDLSILSCDEALISLGAIPAPGEPIVISKVEVRSLIVNLNEDATGALVGWSNLLQSDGGEVHDDGGSTRLSDVFDLQLIEMTNATVVYRSQNSHSEMRFAGFDSRMSIEGASDGWHRIQLNLGRKENSKFEIEGRMNLDEAMLDVSEGHLSMKLAEPGHRLFPPQIQDYLREHEMVGSLGARWNGLVPLTDPLDSKISATMTLTEARAVFDRYVLAVDTFHSNWTLSERTVDVAHFTIAMIDGKVDGKARLSLTAPHASRLAVTFDSMQLRKALRPELPSESSVDGILSGSGFVEARLSDPISSLDASGRVEISRGRLIAIPLVSDLVKVVGGDGTKTGGDELRANVTITPAVPERVQFDDVELVSGAIAARGEGFVTFDSKLDFRWNGGPLERVQSLLGGVGTLFGKVTDKLLKYHTTGTLEQPKTEVRPLGLGPNG